MMKRPVFLGAGVLLSALAACGGPGRYAEKEAFQGDARYRRDFPVAAASLCAAARRVLLGDGYVLEIPSENALIGVKKFQMEKERHAVLQVHVACEPRHGGATLFVSAQEGHFDVALRRRKTTIGLPVVAPIVVSSKREVDQQVETFGETVSDRKFYERFYSAVQESLIR